MQRAADNRLRLIALAYHDCFKPFGTLRHIHIATDEVVEISSLHQRHRHISVVVIVLRHMTVCAALGLSRPDRVREMRTEGNPTIAFCGNRLLLRVYPLAIGVLRAHKNRASRPHWRTSLSGDRSIPSQ